MDPDENIFDGTLSTNICSLDCRSVRVGSYKVRPKDRIVVTEKGVQIQVPAIVNNMEIVTIAIPMTDVLKVLANFKKSMPIFFLYLSPGACKRARASLSMNSKQSFFVDVTSADETQKRLTILPEKLSDESKILLKRHFGSTLLEITSMEANEILVRSNPKYHHVFKQTMQNKVKANGSDIQKEMAPPFNWPLRLKEIDDDTHHLHIPPDITFKIQEDGVTHKVEAHKMVLAMVSPLFHRMLFVLERGDKEVYVEGTTPAAFKTIKNAIYNVVSMENSLEGKSATEVFAVLDLVKRYQIRELKKIVLDHLESFSLTDDTVLEVASAAMKRSQSSGFGGPRLFLRCAKFLRPKFADAQAVFQYLADYKEQKEVIHELLVVMKDLGPSADSMKDLDPSTDTVEEIKHVMDTTDTEDENLAAAIKASLDNAPAKQNIKTVKRKIVGDNTTRARAEANKINIMDMSEDDLSEGETIIRINKRRPRSGKFVNPKQLELSNRGINMVHASTLKSEKSNKWSAGGGKVEKAQHDLKEDVKNEEDSDEKMNKPPAKKAKTSWSKSSTSTR